MPNRSFNAPEYKYGFNGKENDKEVIGTGSGTQDYGMRIYNPALGKFLSVDPIAKNFPWYSPYQFAGNKPIYAIDLDGLEEKVRIYLVHNDGSTSLLRVDNNITTYGKMQAIGKTNVRWNILKERAFDPKLDIGTIQQQYYVLGDNGKYILTNYTRDIDGKLVQGENQILSPGTNNRNAVDSWKNGTIYVGDKNPTVIGKDGKRRPDYRREPVSVIDAAGLAHDQSYDILRANGPDDALNSLRTLGADIKLRDAAKQVMDDYAAGKTDKYTGQKISLASAEQANVVFMLFGTIVNKKIERIANGEKVEATPKK
jgi:RHS repeat-associated protein